MTSIFLRLARPTDALAVANVHVRSWQVGYHDLLPRDYLAALRPEERAKRYTFGSNDSHAPVTIVAEDEGIICGFATTARARDANTPDYGELCALYVDPDWWRRGIGALLISAARAQLLSKGFERAYLWLLRDNFRGDHFYRKDGWATDGVTRMDTVWGLSVEEVRYQRALKMDDDH
jgi:GNAT superfamily N-acetyltransferase